jgi:hypothetical protein
MEIHLTNSNDDLRALEGATQRMLDGIAFNREVYARRVRALIAEVHQLRRQVAAADAEDSDDPDCTVHVKGADFGSMLDDLFGGKR